MKQFNRKFISGFQV